MTDSTVVFLQRKLAELWVYLSGLNFVFSPLYLLSTVLIAAVIWFVVRPRVSIKQFLFPAGLYSHPSSRVDFMLAGLNSLLTGAGGFALLNLAPLVAFKLLDLFGPVSESATSYSALRGVAAVVLLFLLQDFCRFITHYIHHKNRVLWPFHAVHHSAEVLTPLTYFRAHPVYFYIQNLVMSLFIGSMQAVVLLWLVRPFEPWIVFAVTNAYYAYVLAGAHLRHSHIRLRYGNFIEHILISPMQHQVHHSVNQKHLNKNFGEIFALWDWMFGTLYIPSSDEEFTYGLTDESGAVFQPYAGFTQALLLPFKESASAFKTPEPPR